MANQETVALIDVVTRHHVARGRPRDCPLLVWLNAQEDRDPNDVRRDMVARPEWKPQFSAEGLAVTRSPPGQAIYAQALASAPWRESRGLIERVMRDSSLALSQQAIDILVSRLASDHPNPRAFVLQPDVHRALAPSVTIDIERLRAPDFPDVARLRGRVGREGLRP